MSQLVISVSGKRALFNELIHSCRTSSSFFSLNRHHHHRNRLHTFSAASRKALIMNFIHPSTISSSCVVVTPSRLIFNGSTFIFTLSFSSIMCSWLEALNSVGRLNAHIAWSMVLLSVERGGGRGGEGCKLFYNKFLRKISGTNEQIAPSSEVEWKKSNMITNTKMLLFAQTAICFRLVLWASSEQTPRRWGKTEIIMHEKFLIASLPMREVGK